MVIESTKKGFVPVLDSNKAHGIYYITRNGQIKFKNFLIDEWLQDESLPPIITVSLYITIPEDYLIVGLMLDYNLVDPFVDLNAQYEAIKPIEKYLMKRTNIDFIIPENEYRTANVPLYLYFDSGAK